MTSKAAIFANNLSLALGDKIILDDVSVSFNTGELTVLLGPNGTGKSSLLKVITQEWESGKGDIRFFDRDYLDWSPSILAKHLGVLPQSSSLSFNFTVAEVVELGALALTEKQSVIKQLAWKNMIKTDVTHLADRLYPSLSGGEKQRVHLARVLTQLEQSGEQKILLLDEPTSALDLAHQHQTLALAKSLADEGAAVVAVLHDLNLAAQYAHRVMILNQGCIVANGTPNEILTETTIENVYQWPVKVLQHPESGHPVILS